MLGAANLDSGERMIGNELVRLPLASLSANGLSAARAGYAPVSRTMLKITAFIAIGSIDSSLSHRRNRQRILAL